ncbi:aspartic proteinase 36-like [Cicer arietinum]|uniref:aspartic proteinase 36-like n=1 Tax=Cicer arietinum TaxID=3827 RepID=UPI003CC622A0
MVPSQIHYTLNLQSIYVNGKQLPINPNVFAPSYDQGIIVDSGTTLTYIVQEAYNPIIHADDTTWCIGFQKVEKGLTIFRGFITP